MTVCPNCGHENDQTAAICTQCNQALPPVMPEQSPTAAPALHAPIQLPTVRAQDTRRKGRQYLLGLGLGLIPLIFLLIGLGFAVNTTNGTVTAIFVLIGAAFSIAAVIAMIVCLSIKKVRFVGYGLLTLVLASLIVTCIACVVSIQNSPPL